MGTGVDRSSQEWPLVPGTRWRYVVLLGFCLAAATAYIPRNSISAAESSIRKELSLTKKQTRWIIIGFFITYAGMQIPTGQLGHAWGTRRSLMGFAGLGSLGVGGVVEGDQRRRDRVGADSPGQPPFAKGLLKAIANIGRGV